MKFIPFFALKISFSQINFFALIFKHTICVYFSCFGLQNKTWMIFSIITRLTSEDIPEHNPVTNDLSKYDWYTCIRASIDHKNTSDTPFKSPRHIEYIFKLYWVISLSPQNILSDFFNVFPGQNSCFSDIYFKVSSNTWPSKFSFSIKIV